MQRGRSLTDNSIDILISTFGIHDVGARLSEDRCTLAVTNPGNYLLSSQERVGD